MQQCSNCGDSVKYINKTYRLCSDCLKIYKSIGRKLPKIVNS